MATGRESWHEEERATELLGCEGDGVALVASRHPPVPREIRPSFHVRSSRKELPGGDKKPKTIIPLTAGSSSRLISAMRARALSR